MAGTREGHGLLTISNRTKKKRHREHGVALSPDSSLLTIPWNTLGRKTQTAKRFAPGVGYHYEATRKLRIAAPTRGFPEFKINAGLKPRFTRPSRQLYTSKYYGELFRRVDLLYSPLTNTRASMKNILCGPLMKI